MIYILFKPLKTVGFYLTVYVIGAHLSIAKNLSNDYPDLGSHSEFSGSIVEIYRTSFVVEKRHIDRYYTLQIRLTDHITANEDIKNEQLAILKEWYDELISEISTLNKKGELFYYEASSEKFARRGYVAIDSGGKVIGFYRESEEIKS